MEADQHEHDEPPILHELAELAAQAELGDESILPELRRLLKQHPEVWGHVGNLARQAQDSQIYLATGPNLLAKAALEQKLEHMREELSEPTDSCLEQMVVERVLTTWLWAEAADALRGQVGEVSPKVMRFMDERADRGNRRFLLAAKQLPQVRKLVHEAKLFRGLTT